MPPYMPFVGRYASLSACYSRFTVGQYSAVLRSLSLSALLTPFGRERDLFSPLFPVSLLG